MIAFGADERGEALPFARDGVPIWHLVISGFTQRLERPSGAQYLWNALRGVRADACDAAALLEPWNADWVGIADLIWRFRPLDRPARVYVYAYSWGGGWGFLSLARELRKRDVAVEHAVLCDAVYRPRCRLFDFLALTSLPTIKVPANVRQVSWFYQRGGTPPMGHEVRAVDARATRINRGVEMKGVAHEFMDDAAAWWQKSLSVAGGARPAEPYDSIFRRLDAAHPNA